MMTKEEIKHIVEETVNELLKCKTCFGVGMVEGYSSKMYRTLDGKHLIKCPDCDGTGLRLKF